MTKSRPPSETSILLNLAGLLSFFIAVYFAILPSDVIDISSTHGQVHACLLSIIATILPIIIGDLFIRKIYTHHATHLTKKQPINLSRCSVKYLGLLTTFGVIGFVYWVFPEYGNYYERYFSFLSLIVPYLLIGGLIYFPLVDRHMEQPNDSYWHVGMATLRLLRLTSSHHINRTYLAEHTRSWLVKAFFLPLMFTFLSDNINFLINFDYNQLPSYTNLFSSPKHFGILFEFLYSTIFTIDVVFAAVGYLMTFRILNAHIRSAEPTMVGWIVCIMCYPPFWAGMLSGQYFAYNDELYWGAWLIESPILYTVWGCMILLCISIYSLATVALGYRFSNLTYRGLVTSGPYRFTKHPAYITKCISWWLISIPFISTDGPLAAVKMSCLLGFLCIIYYLRARTEENHLSNYPEYVQYANWINEHGIFRLLSKPFPFLRYSEQRCLQSRSIIWKKKITADTPLDSTNA